MTHLPSALSRFFLLVGAGLFAVLLAPSAANAQASQKLTLDGQLDYASVTESPDLNFEGSDDNITLEGWIKHNGESDVGGRIFDNLDDSGRGYDLHLGRGRLGDHRGQRCAQRQLLQRRDRRVSDLEYCALAP